MVSRSESELIRYLADNSDRARLVLRGVPDTRAALAALRQAAAAVGRIPQPAEAGRAPEEASAVRGAAAVEAAMEDGLPVLRLDVKDGGRYARQIVATIVAALDTQGIGGRLEPFPRGPAPAQAGLPGTRPQPGPEPVAPGFPGGPAGVTPEQLGLRADTDGLLYQRGVRETAGGLLAPRSLLGCETCVALRALGDALHEFGRRLPGSLRLDDRLRPLRPLRHRRSGVPLDELLDHVAQVLGTDDPVAHVEACERSGLVDRKAGGSAGSRGRPVQVTLTERGHQIFDDYLRRLADAQAVLLGGIGADQLVAIRHVFLTMPAASTARTLDLDAEDDRRYDRGRRRFLGALEPERVLVLETMSVLVPAALGAPRLPLPAERRALPLWWLYQQPSGIPRGPIVDSLGRDGIRAIDELVRAGLVTHAQDSTGADTTVLRLTGSGDRVMDELVRDLSRDMADRFGGVDLGDLARTRDGCWRMVLNAHRAAAAPRVVV